MAETVIVPIAIHPQKPHECIVERRFTAQRGDAVEFRFDEGLKLGALITFFRGTPFDAVAFRPGRKAVRPDATIGTYEYFVSWDGLGGGMGNGTGEVTG